MLNTKRQKESHRVFEFRHPSIIISLGIVNFFFFSLYLLSFNLLPSNHYASTTVDVRVLELFHPQEIRVITKKDTFFVQLKNDYMSINGKKENVFFQKDESIIVEIRGKIEREFNGTLKIYPRENEIIIVNTVLSDDYLASIVGAEMGNAPFEAQKAQAIVSRTYLYKNLKRHKHYDFCDLTHCQVYKGREAETEKTRKAVEETDRIVLWNGNKIADIYYHSTCGGQTADFTSIFEGTNEYLVSILDSNFCKDSPHYRWEWKLSVEEAPFAEIRIATRAPDGRVTEIDVDGENEKGWKFRMRLARQFGWNKLRSSWFTVEKNETYFHFKGKGIGHGLGMCQWGAKELAKQGKTAEEILKHYYPKLQLGIRD